jgi:hypothetical protein
MPQSGLQIGRRADDFLGETVTGQPWLRLLLSHARRSTRKSLIG